VIKQRTRKYRMPQAQPQKIQPQAHRVIAAIYIGVMLLVLGLAGLGLWQAWQLHSVTLGLLVTLLLFGVLVAFTMGMRLIRSQLLQPLYNIQQWAQQLRTGQLDARLQNTLPSEFANLSSDIDQISQKLQLLSEDMQNQVRTQTQFIAQKTHSLEIIYDVAASINVSRDLDDLLTRFLHTLKEVVNARAAVVRLVTEDEQMRLVASTGLNDEVISREQLLPASTCLCGSAYDKGTVQYQPDIRKCDKIIGHSFFNDDNVGMIAVPLQYRDRTLGVYNLFVDKSMMAYAEEINDLLTSIGRHLGMAIDKARLDDETNRLSIMEERTRLAHELHDSLAQTLASLRFQVRVLDENLRLGEEPAVWHELEKIENNLDEAYAELRELITHFRAPIDKRGLVPGVQYLVNRFRNQTGIHIYLQQEWNIVQLPASFEVEVLRIIQEALNNIRKHSQAQNVRILLRAKPQGDCLILIEDDGIGIDASKSADKKRDHYGLNIMAERTKRINGDLKIESEPGEGTRVILTFNYANVSNNTVKPIGTDSVRVTLPNRRAEL
jgi:two-component system nitrate/nitrite sensor histidine kinase NarX